MLIIDGFFENGVFVPEKPLTAITGRQRAVLNIDNTGETAEEKNAKRQEAFQHFTQYRGTLPAGFDYTKELSEYRNERYGHID
jgi:predicted DNA-binding antitoxin AbrB/MazE fold protein